MSQINDYTDVSIAEELATPAMAPLCLNTVLQEALEETLRSTGGTQMNVTSTVRTTTCLPPTRISNELRTITREFEQDQKSVGQHVAKAKALTAIVSANAAYGEQHVIAPLVQRFNQAPANVSADALNKLVEVMTHQYGRAYDGVTEHGIVAALDAVGMRLNKTVRKNGATQYLSMDKEGRGIEVRMARTPDGKMQMRTSTKGFEGGTCHPAMDRFLEALGKQGIVLRHERRTVTGGDCASPLNTQTPATVKSKQRQ